MGDSSETTSAEIERLFNQYTTGGDYQTPWSATDEAEAQLNDTQHSFSFEEASSLHTVLSDKFDTSDSASITSYATENTSTCSGDTIHCPYKQEQANDELGEMQVLNLEHDTVSSHQMDTLQTLMKVLMDCKKIVVVAGAGISVSAGIPDFRSKKGIFQEASLRLPGRNYETIFNFNYAANREFEPVVTETFINLLQKIEHARPTEFHRMLGWLASEGRLLRLYTQNIDGLDVATPFLDTTVPLPTRRPWPQTIQLHGSIRHLKCNSCQTIIDVDHNSFGDDKTWDCEPCKQRHHNRPMLGITRGNGASYRRKTCAILYDDPVEDGEAIKNVMKADGDARPDALIVVGTTLKIDRLKDFTIKMAKQVKSDPNGVTIWMNTKDGPKGPKSSWSLFVKGACDNVAHQWIKAYEDRSNQNPRTRITWQTMSGADDSPQSLVARQEMVKRFVCRGSKKLLDEERDVTESTRDMSERDMARKRRKKTKRLSVVASGSISNNGESRE